MVVQSLRDVNEVVSNPRRSLRWLMGELRWMARVIISSCDRFYWDNGFSRSASLAYTMLVSLVPLTALGFGILASFKESSPLLPAVQQFFFGQFVPTTTSTQMVLEYLNGFSSIMSSLNAVVIGFLVFTALLLINSVEYALNAVWQVHEPRTIAHRIAIFSSIILIGPVLAVSGFYFAKFRLAPLFAGAFADEYLSAVYTYLVPFVIDVIAFTSLFYLVPKAAVRFRSAAFGGFVAALLFDMAKAGFVIYIEQFSSYGKVYGALAAVPIFLFWLYLAWTIVLFGAEVSYQAQYLPRTGHLWKRTLLSVGDARLVLGIQSLLTIARAFESGTQLPNDIDIAEQLGCSSIVLKSTLDALERARIIARADSPDMSVTLLRNPETVTINEVRKALFADPSPMHYPEELEKLFGSLRAGTDGATSLSDILSSAQNNRED